MSGRVQFGEFVLDLGRTRAATRRRARFRFRRRPFELLETLVASRPKALSKIALQERLWPGTFVVEKNLVNLIAEIRAGAR